MGDTLRKAARHVRHVALAEFGYPATVVKLNHIGEDNEKGAIIKSGVRELIKRRSR
jgi:hypothetical protein